MRLNVYLQKAGIGSRREAERMVEDGRVSINGKLATPTMPVADGDQVTLDGKAVAPDTAPIPRLYMLHKPLDVLVTAFDKQGRAIVYELPALNQKNMPRVMYVGRLDVNSEGLLMLSTDGALAQAMMSPAMALERVYRVRVHGRLTAADIKAMARGVEVDNVFYRGAKVAEERAPTGHNTWYQIILTEGKNREIRKLMAHFGCVVNRLIRIQYGPFSLGDLPAGGIKEVPQKQVEKLIAQLRDQGAKI